MHPTTTTPVILLSERIYRALLILYPADYRREYGWLMVQVFRDVCRETYSQHGIAGIALWWCSTFLDLALTAFEQRRKTGVVMSKASFIRFSGVLLIMGGIGIALASFSQLQPGSHYTYRGIYQLLIFMLLPGFLLLGLGLFGLALHYGKTAGSLVQFLLIGYGIGALLITFGFAVAQLNDSLWKVAEAGFVLFGVSGSVFGLLHLWMPLLPVHRVLPLLVIVPFALQLLRLFPSSDGYDPDWMFFVVFLLIGAGWVIVGYNVHKQLHRSVASPSFSTP